MLQPPVHRQNGRGGDLNPRPPAAACRKAPVRGYLTVPGHHDLRSHQTGYEISYEPTGCEGLGGPGLSGLGVWIPVGPVGVVERAEVSLSGLDRRGAGRDDVLCRLGGEWPVAEGRDRAVERCQGAVEGFGFLGGVGAAFLISARSSLMVVRRASTVGASARTSMSASAPMARSASSISAQSSSPLDSSVMNVSIATVAKDVGTTVTGIQTAITCTRW